MFVLLQVRKCCSAKTHRVPVFFLDEHSPSNMGDVPFTRRTTLSELSQRELLRCNGTVLGLCREDHGMDLARLREFSLSTGAPSLDDTRIDFWKFHFVLCRHIMCTLLL